MIQGTEGPYVRGAAEMARRIGIGRRTFERWVAAGDVPCIRRRRVRLFRPEEVFAAIESRFTEEARPSTRLPRATRKVRVL